MYPKNQWKGKCSSTLNCSEPKEISTMKCCSLSGYCVWYHSVEVSKGKQALFILCLFSIKYYWLLTVQTQCLALVSLISRTEKWSIWQWPKFLQYGSTCSDLVSQTCWLVLAWRWPSIAILQQKGNKWCSIEMSGANLFYASFPSAISFP